MITITQKKYLFFIFIIVIFFSCSGGGDKSITNSNNDTSSSLETTVKIASFNIQVFGRSKAGKTDVMNTLAQIITSFDIVAIQEIRDSSGTAIDKLEKAVDSLGTDYEYVIGPRLGRTSSKEQYAFIYKADSITVNNTITYPDTEDNFHREPFIGQFLYGNTTFVIGTIHTDPDEATPEINKLVDVFDYIKNKYSKTTKMMIVGDYNADCRYFDEDEMAAPLRDSQYYWVTGNELDTNLATSDCTYDRIVTMNIDQSEIDSSGVYLFDEVHGLRLDEAKDVSDHYPVWISLKW